MENIYAHGQITVYRGQDSKSIIPIDQNLADRLLQDEVYSQTCWPDDYLSTVEIVSQYEQKLTQKLKAEKLAADNWLVHLIKGALAFGVSRKFEKEVCRLFENGDHIGTEMWNCLNEMYCDFIDRADLDGWKTYVYWIDDESSRIDGPDEF